MSRQWRHVFRKLLFILLLLSIVGGLGYLAYRYPVQRDVTFVGMNSLEPASVDVLNTLTGVVKVTVYATEQDAQHGDLRKIIRDFFSLYQRYKSDIKLTFIDPEKESDKARAAHIQLNGEMIIEYAGRSEHLTKLNEPLLTNTLMRLARSSTQTVMYLDGHGERKLDGVANFDLGNPFGAKLKQNGFKISGLNLAIAPDIPQNISVLVITQPQLDLMAGEVDKLLRYVEKGGNLLWLVDAEALHGLEPLAEKLGLILPTGIVVDPAAQEMRAPVTWALGASYTPHPITQSFDLITAFPSARPLLWNEHAGWKTLVEVAPRGWVSQTALLGKFDFDKRNDTKGPVTIAAALQRTVNDRDQRIVVVGSGEFLANSFAGNGGNVTLGLNMLNWLSNDERMITLHPRASKDTKLELSEKQLVGISLTFLVALPLMLAGWGGYLWWKRRRA
ncbi:MAG: GldG family protein [Gallionella sp.]|nr:GldG family protein [Gallionella sp.]MDD4960070.1 GldG family protein [Gallionella sp.]